MLLEQMVEVMPTEDPTGTTSSSEHTKTHSAPATPGKPATEQTTRLLRLQTFLDDMSNKDYKPVLLKHLPYGETQYAV